MTMHYEQTYDEVRAEGRFTDRRDQAARPNPICRNGSFHAETTRDRAKVDCPVCLATLERGRALRYNEREALEFAHRIKALGFEVSLAEGGHYGFITDATHSRVMCFAFNGLESNLGGNYGPPSHESGTGWQLSKDPGDLKTAEDVRAALYEAPNPRQCGNGWKYFTTLSQYLALYGRSSRFTEV